MPSAGGARGDAQILLPKTLRHLAVLFLLLPKSCGAAGLVQFPGLKACAAARDRVPRGIKTAFLGGD